MAIYTSVVAAACLFMITISTCAALNYTVGDAAGWTLGVDYSSWTCGKIFNIGDNLVFSYCSGHTVHEVNGDDYISCTPGNAISAHSSGATSIPLLTPGNHYFMCAASNHCIAGMKLAVTVSADTVGSTSTPAPPTPCACAHGAPYTPPGPAPPTPCACAHGAPYTPPGPAPPTPCACGTPYTPSPPTPFYGNATPLTDQPQLVISGDALVALSNVWPYFEVWLLALLLL